MKCSIGIDVGTGSARAGIFDAAGRLLAQHTEGIAIGRPQTDFVEQSSTDIWRAVSRCTRQVMRESGVAPENVAGIGFDGTCSLVLIDQKGSPVSVSPTGDDDWNVMVWMDHRALRQTAEVNGAGAFPVYDYVGGQISPEMQVPKLLWLKQHLPEAWRRAEHFFDLPDFLTWRATGAVSRSLCSLTCKWTYLAHEAEAGRTGWHSGFFEAAGLGDLAMEGFRRIGNVVQPMGTPVGDGLTVAAAAELGLAPGTPVGTSMVDAHAGGIGMIGLDLGDGAGFDSRLALIGGTSSCHMAVSSQPREIRGVWGPYYSAMIPGLWLNEGGQSATGSLVDHVVIHHGSSAEAEALARSEGTTIYEVLNQRLVALSGDMPMHALSRELHVCPYFHGNRSPRANPHLVGMISGLRLSATLDDLALLYLATIQAIACGTRHIVETMNRGGYAIDTLICCGGGTKNPVFLQQHADITGCRLVLPEEPESVLLGSAMLGFVASGRSPSLQAAMKAMSRPGRIIQPDARSKSYHDAKYSVFHALHDHQIEYAGLMASVTDNLPRLEKSPN
jgi:FGGY-family pentulose kinase